MNTFRLLCIALLPGFVIAGVLVPTGSIIGTAANYLDVAAAEVAVYFTGLTGGLFLGYILSFFVFDHFRIKTVIIVSYSIAVLAVISSQTIESLFGLFAHLLVIGTMIGLVSCASSSIISHLWGGKKRQTALVAQDAMFNVGGAMAASATGYFIQQQYAWNMTYFCVSAVVVLVILLTVCSSFRDVGAADNTADEPAGGGAGEPLKTEWNAGIILIGVSVLLFMFTKAVMIIWTPQYMEQILLVDAKRASEFMSNVYLAALVGSILITLLSSRINVTYLIGSLVLLGIVITWVITLSDEAGTVLLLGYVFGIALSATLHAYLALGLTFVDNPNHKHIAFVLLAAGFGSTIAPYISSKLVLFTGDVTSSIYLSCYSFVAIFCTLLVAVYLNSRKRHAAASVPG